MLHYQYGKSVAELIKHLLRDGYFMSRLPQYITACRWTRNLLVYNLDNKRPLQDIRINGTAAFPETEVAKIKIADHYSLSVHSLHSEIIDGEPDTAVLLLHVIDQPKMFEEIKKVIATLKAKQERLDPTGQKTVAVLKEIQAEEAGDENNDDDDNDNDENLADISSPTESEADSVELDYHLNMARITNETAHSYLLAIASKPDILFAVLPTFYQSIIQEKLPEVGSMSKDKSINEHIDRADLELDVLLRLMRR